MSASCLVNDKVELRIPLAPLPIARRLSVVLMLMVTATAVGACLAGAGALALCWLLAGALLAAGLRRDVWLRGPDAPAELVAYEKAGLHIVRQHGQIEIVTLAAGSVFLGNGAMLVLEGEKTSRLLLGSGNVNPDQLAALRRLLRGLRA